MRACRHKTAQRTYEAILLALHGLADVEGLYCRATNAEIGEDARRSPATVKQYLALMELRGEVLILGHADGYPRRTIILLDHPSSGRVVAGMFLESRARGLMQPA